MDLVEKGNVARIAIKKDDKVVSDIDNVSVDDMINVSIKNGIINAKVVEVNNGK